jgi:hypothetical protein
MIDGKAEARSLAMQQTGNPYIAYGLAAGGREGILLKFSKSGQWQAGLGDDITILPNGTALQARMEYVAIVYTKWVASKPVDRKVTLVGTGAQPPRREDLGDDKAADWDLDDEGKPRDPWQMTNELPLIDPASGEQYVFSTSSRGGLAALGRLSVSYGRNFAKHAGEDPVVRLDSSGYDHPIKRYGYVHTPDFKIIGWELRTPGDAPPRLTSNQEMNDEIPF